MDDEPEDEDVEEIDFEAMFVYVLFQKNWWRWHGPILGACAAVTLIELGLLTPTSVVVVCLILSFAYKRRF